MIVPVDILKEFIVNYGGNHQITVDYYTCLEDIEKIKKILSSLVNIKGLDNIKWKAAKAIAVLENKKQKKV